MGSLVCRKDEVMSRPALYCAGCHKTPVELPEYFSENTGEDLSPDDYVWTGEGTLNRRTGQFLCTRCYIAEGMPSAPGGWTVPDSWV